MGTVIKLAARLNGAVFCYFLHLSGRLSDYGIRSLQKFCIRFMWEYSLWSVYDGKSLWPRTVRISELPFENRSSKDMSDDELDNLVLWNETVKELCKIK